MEIRSIEFLTEEEVRESTKHDETRLQVTNTLGTAKWPVTLVKPNAIANDLRYLDGILIKNGCAVIPQNLQLKALEVVHVGHPLEAI